MDPRQILVAPQAAGYAVQGVEDLLGLPVVLIQHGLEIAGWLMEIEDQGVMGDHPS